ncbi:MAG: CHAT domain-containing protein [Cyanobacteria bacterium P01_E01_bin.6]
MLMRPMRQSERPGWRIPKRLTSLMRLGAIALFAAIMCVASSHWNHAAWGAMSSTVASPPPSLPTSQPTVMDVVSGHSLDPGRWAIATNSAAHIPNNQRPNNQRPNNQRPNNTNSSVTVAQRANRDAQQLYADGNYEQVVARLTEALQASQSNPVGQAVMLSNLSLTYQQLGDWQAADETIGQAMSILQSDDARSAPDQGSVLAQALDVQGSYYLAVGDGESAVEAWETSAQVFDEIGLSARAAMGRVNQAQALQSLGFYQQAIALLQTLQNNFLDTPDSLEKAAALRSLGEAQRVVGKLSDAQEALEASLAIALALDDSEAIAQTYLSLGNASRAGIDLFSTSYIPSHAQISESQALTDSAATYYRQAAAQSDRPIIQTQAALNVLSLFIEVENWDEAIRFYPGIGQQLSALPPGRPAVYAQVNYAQSLVQLKNERAQITVDWSEIAQLLTNAYQQAVELNDSRAQSFALGHLGELYEKTTQWDESQTLTRRALALAQSINAQDIAYRWQWQLGQVLKESGEYDNALSAYSEAFNTLQLLRSDLAAANADIKFSFRKSVEPVYREYVDLLLRPGEQPAEANQDRASEPGQRPLLSTDQANLRRARDVMEALQVAQLENFFQSACLEPKLQIDSIIQEQNQQAAVIYPIILADRLEILVKLPQSEDLMHYAPVYMPQEEVETYLREFRRDLQGLYTYRRVEEKGKVIYDWLIGQADEQFAQNNIETLIFVLDGSLRNIPMAALYDGTQYVVQKYAVDLVLGLEVSGIQSLDRSKMRVLAAGLVDPPVEFQNTYARLTNVKAELDMIQESDIRSVLLREDSFRRKEFNDEFNNREFQVVHLATHGQFGADRESTFILDAEGKVALDDLSELFGTERQVSDAPIQLLIMSACRTATGDDREVLGIAGTTVRAGARSALASLWSLDDEASVTFTSEFYKHLGQPGISRAEAVRLAQEMMLNNPNFNHPRFWSAYVLVGSWL